MGNRIELHNKLKEILGTNHVYFQPPENMRIVYPAIIYTRSNIKNIFADDEVYKQNYFYTITVIDFSPDSEIVSKMSMMPRVKFDRHFTSDGLNHDVFNIYY